MADDLESMSNEQLQAIVQQHAAQKAAPPRDFKMEDMDSMSNEQLQSIVGQHNEQRLAPYRQEALENERKAQATAPFSWERLTNTGIQHSYYIRKAMSVGDIIPDISYGKALDRFHKGEESEDDKRLIAKRQLQDAMDAQRSQREQFIGGAAGIPGQVAGLMAGGKLAEAADVGLGARAISATQPTTTAQLPGLLGRVLPSTPAIATEATSGALPFVARTATQAALTPNLAPHAIVQQNIEAGRDPLDIKGVAPGMAKTMAEAAVLQGAGKFWGKVLPSRVNNALGGFPAAGLTGPISQMVTDTTTYGLGLNSRYGRLQDIAEGKYGQAASGLTLDMFNFMAMHTMHGREPEAKKTVENFVEELNKQAEAGKGPEQAIQTAAAEVFAGSKETADAFREVFPESRVASGRLLARAGDTNVFLEHNPDNGAVRLDFTDAAGREMGEASAKRAGVSQDLRRGSLELARKLRDFVGQMKEQGQDVEYTAKDEKRDPDDKSKTRAEIYADLMTKAGFTQVESRPGVAGDTYYRWAAKEQPKATETPESAPSQPTAPPEPQKPPLNPREAATAIEKQHYANLDAVTAAKMAEERAKGEQERGDIKFGRGDLAGARAARLAAQKAAAASGKRVDAARIAASAWEAEQARNQPKEAGAVASAKEAEQGGAAPPLSTALTSKSADPEFVEAMQRNLADFKSMNQPLDLTREADAKLAISGALWKYAEMHPDETIVHPDVHTGGWTTSIGGRHATLEEMREIIKRWHAPQDDPYVDRVRLIHKDGSIEIIDPPIKDRVSRLGSREEVYTAYSGNSDVDRLMRAEADRQFPPQPAEEQSWFGRPGPKTFGRIRGDQQSAFQGHPEIPGSSGAWMDRAREFLEGKGEKVGQFQQPNQVRTAEGKVYQGKMDEKGEWNFEEAEKPPSLTESERLKEIDRLANDPMAPAEKGSEGDVLPEDLHRLIDSSALEPHEKGLLKRLLRAGENDSLRKIANGRGISHETLRKQSIDALHKIDPNANSVEDLLANERLKAVERRKEAIKGLTDEARELHEQIKGAEDATDAEAGRVPELGPDGAAPLRQRLEQRVQAEASLPEGNVAGAGVAPGPSAQAAGQAGAPGAQPALNPAAVPRRRPTRRDIVAEGWHPPMTTPQQRVAARAANKVITLISVVRKAGIDKGEAERNGWNVDLIEQDFKGLFKKGGMNLAELAEMLGNEGHTEPIPEEMQSHPGDWLLDKLSRGALSLQSDTEHRYAQESLKADQEAAEAARLRIPASTIEETRRAFEADGENEGSQQDLEELARELQQGREGNERGPVNAAASEFNPDEFEQPAPSVEQRTRERFDQPGGERRAGVEPPKAPVSEPKPENVDPIEKTAKEFATKESGFVTPEAIAAYTFTKAAEIKGALQHLGHFLAEFGHVSFPRTTAVDRESGEALGRYSGSSEWGRRAGPIYTDKVMGPDATPEQKRMAGAVITERRLRTIRDAYQDIADQAQIIADDDPTPENLNALHDAQQAADNVKSIIGVKNSPLTSEAVYQEQLKSDFMKGVFERWKEHMTPIMGELYRKGEGMQADDPINSRTQIPDEPVNLKRIQEGDERSPSAVMFGNRQGNLLNRKQFRSPFTRQATGASELGYDIDIGNIISNSLQRGAEVAAKREMFDTFKERGLGQQAEPGTQATINGARAKQIDGVFKGKESSFYIDPRAYDEVINATQIERPFLHLPGTNALARASLASLLELAFHTKNQLTQLMKSGFRPVDLYRNARDYLKNTPEVQDRILELARMDALKPSGTETPGTFGSSKYNVFKYSQRFLDGLSDVMRLTASDMFDRMAGTKPDLLYDTLKRTTGWRPLAENTETNKRDFINQLGKYNKKSQNVIVRWLRESGIGPFATAGTNYYTQGVKGALTLGTNTGVTAVGAGSKLAFRTEMLAKSVGVLATVALTNYLFHGRADGDDGTPLGAIKLGEDKGKTISYDMAELMGLKRNLRSLGLLAVLEGERHGKSDQTVAVRARDEALMAALHPAMGPAVSDVYTAATGRDTMGRQVAPKVGGKDSAVQDLLAAGRQANPLVHAATQGYDTPKKPPSVWERIANQLGPFGPKFRPTKK